MVLESLPKIHSAKEKSFSWYFTCHFNASFSFCKIFKSFWLFFVKWYHISSHIYAQIFLQDKENSMRWSLLSPWNESYSVWSSDMNSHSPFGPAQHIIQLLKVGQLGSFYLNRLSIYFYWVSVVECIIIVNAWPLAAKLLAAKTVIGGWLAIAIQVRARPFPSHGHLRIYSLCAPLYFACWNGTFVFVDFTLFIWSSRRWATSNANRGVCIMRSSVWARPHQLMRLSHLFWCTYTPNSAWNRTAWILTFWISVLMPNQKTWRRKSV
jgi:hypothetical protein